jgi:hypothetical protein
LVSRFSAYHFPGNPQALGDHVVQFLYGRKITGRLALQLAGGPDVTTFRVPVNSSTHRVSGATMGSLIYAFPRSSINVSYSHGVSNGSGLLSGATTDLINGGWSRQLTRMWGANINVSYANNRQILAISGFTSPRFNTWNVGAGVGRPLGRTANFSLGYQAQIQTANVALCNRLNCGNNATVHQIFTTLQWHARPLVLR